MSPGPRSSPSSRPPFASEGGPGLAKALSFLHVLKRKQIVASPEVSRMYEMVSKLLIRELADATGETPRNIEDKIARGMRQKLIPNNDLRPCIVSPIHTQMPEAR